MDWRRVAMRLGLPRTAAAPAHALGVFHAAGVLHARGERQAAEDAYREGLSIDPNHENGLRGFAALLDGLGRSAEALPFHRRIAGIAVDRLGIAPEHRAEAVDYELAQGRVAPAPPRVPPAYVEKLFDHYADDFDTHLVATLGYCAPELLRALLVGWLGRDDPGFDTLDIGCGTGLSGLAFRSLSARLDGVDQSPRMLDKARARGIYDRLACGDLIEVLAGRPQAYDLLVAADVLVYFGDLAPAFAAAATALRSSSLFLFSVERGDDPGFFMSGSGRYCHSLEYLRTTAAAAGFDEALVREAVLRQEQNAPVHSHMVLLRKRDTGLQDGQR